MAFCSIVDKAEAKAGHSGLEPEASRLSGVRNVVTTIERQMVLGQEVSLFESTLAAKVIQIGQGGGR